MAELSGMDAFAHLGSELRTALSEQGFSTPTEPQREAIPPLADGKNALVLAPTGTGKTETAMLPVFDAIVDARDAPGDQPRSGISALYITPLRALNRDMMDRLSGGATGSASRSRCATATPRDTSGASRPTTRRTC